METFQITRAFSWIRLVNGSRRQTLLPAAYGKPNGAKFKKRHWLHVQQISCQGQEIFRSSSTKLSHFQQVSTQGQDIP